MTYSKTGYKHFILKDQIKGMIFDLDGTIADNMPLHLEAWQETCKEFGMEMTGEFLRSHTGSPGITIASLLIDKFGKQGINPQDIADRKHERYWSVLHKVKEVDAVTSIIKRYHTKMKMAVGSGGQRETVIKTLEYLKMTDYFPVIVSANDVSNHKPDPETFTRCAELMKLPPNEIIVFEDGDLGIEAAESAGMEAIDVRPWYDYNW